MSYHDLRLKLHKLADQGIIDRVGCYALLEVLQTSGYRPDMGNKVEQATNLLEALADLVEPPAPSPARPHIAIIGAPDSVAAMLATVQAHPYARELDFTGVAVTFREPPSEKAAHLHVQVADIVAPEHHRPRAFYSTRLFGPIEDELAALDAMNPPAPVFPPVMCFRDRLGYEKEPPPPPKFSGYHGNGKRRKYPRPK